ncbi:MAG: 50S ribosomal protein L6 [Candidatus Nealsonbacteria bacterium RIFCSPLOWO2_12_FULL_39_31]|uniref:Large ribosomal subunit protein uL6 n=2 Tax=Candidatus Nealsoniibacteriota TaxID=1817911 RepID=A0A1G2EIH6_9BACT|nr:MAG: 50S ribosomal protein L6 [Candidatus Nealsonbacteria bacterium RIFCSPHIGHO2_02_38_10]OGZ23041.1 MAG: 50S ribosomal protein L6 [Candidatus Nealsonbacteria bacterium RIFCSPHIGHO2_12_FULL_38_18]OGZ25028.1 MAG: 50S ribosomal protein L6 [Candidatus Nealsonbacteria bacterium RIFCSPLOWO2_02_39_8]OGZ27037.1 MAG: 50S ribosomal protein L6 [Candidatus Nealsonbacteria bacterium RIFCSPLOWO2_12_FULL_39_31]
MSRIGKKPILIPDGVDVKIGGSMVAVKGPKGELQREVLPEIKVEIEGKEIKISPQKETKKTGAFWGLTRALIFNMVKGVKDGFEKKLQIEGVGYKANLEGENLVLQVGFSHPVKIDKDGGIKFTVEKNIITISGPDKELVGQVSAKIRKIRPPEPYKGKGIRYLGEVVARKAGKKVVASGGA